MLYTVYYGITFNNEKIYFKSKKAIRNCQVASEITKTDIKEFRLAPLFYQFFSFLIKDNR